MCLGDMSEHGSLLNAKNAKAHDGPKVWPMVRVDLRSIGPRSFEHEIDERDTIVSDKLKVAENGRVAGSILSSPDYKGKVIHMETLSSSHRIVKALNPVNVLCITLSLVRTEVSILVLYGPKVDKVASERLLDFVFAELCSGMEGTSILVLESTICVEVGVDGPWHERNTHNNSIGSVGEARIATKSLSNDDLKSVNGGKGLDGIRNGHDCGGLKPIDHASVGELWSDDVDITIL